MYTTGVYKHDTFLYFEHLILTNYNSQFTICKHFLRKIYSISITYIHCPFWREPSLRILNKIERLKTFSPVKLADDSNSPSLFFPCFSECLNLQMRGEEKQGKGDFMHEKTFSLIMLSKFLRKNPKGGLFKKCAWIRLKCMDIIVHYSWPKYEKVRQQRLIYFFLLIPLCEYYGILKNFL